MPSREQRVQEQQRETYRESDDYLNVRGVDPRTGRHYPSVVGDVRSEYLGREAGDKKCSESHRASRAKKWKLEGQIAEAQRRATLDAKIAEEAHAALLALQKKRASIDVWEKEREAEVQPVQPPSRPRRSAPPSKRNKHEKNAEQNEEASSSRHRSKGRSSSAEEIDTSNRPSAPRKHDSLTSMILGNPFWCTEQASKLALYHRSQ